jgi:hypothetical protein
MYNTSNEHIEHLTKLQVSIAKPNKAFYKKVKRFLLKGFKKIFEVSANSTVWNNKPNGQLPYMYKCLN